MLNYPNIDRGRTPQQNFEEIKSWAYQTIEQINYELEQLQKAIEELGKEVEDLKKK